MPNWFCNRMYVADSVTLGGDISAALVEVRVVEGKALDEEVVPEKPLPAAC